MDKIDYIYFDVDNSKILPSLEDLKEVYFKGVKTVHEHIYPNYSNGQVLHAMSSDRQCEVSLRIRLKRLTCNRA